MSQQSAQTLAVTVAATENSLRIFDIQGAEAANGADWENLPKVKVSASPASTLRDVLERASEQLGISLSQHLKDSLEVARRANGDPPREDTVVDRLAFAAFRCPDDDDVVDSAGTKRRTSRLGSTLVLVTRDEQGHAVWRRPPFDVTMAELIDAADAGLIDGDPLQPYLVLVVPQGDFGLFAEWERFRETLELLWDISGAMGQVGGAWAFVELLRKVIQRRSSAANKAIEQNAEAWSSRGASPDDVIAFLRQKPRRTEEISQLLGCAPKEAEAVLWALGCAEIDGLWKWRGDPVADFLADDLELQFILATYRGEENLRAELARRLRELGERGRSASADEEKREIHDEFVRKMKSE